MRNRRAAHSLVAAIGAIAAMVLAPLAARAQAPALSADSPKAALSGLVAENSKPVAAAAVYAYRLGELVSLEDEAPAAAKLTRVVTNVAGRFLFEQLPPGLYQIVAHKAGFVPAIVELTRETATTSQVVELDLVPDQVGDLRQGEDYWARRSRIESDVLREIEFESFDQQANAGLAAESDWASNALKQFDGDVGFMVGTDDTHSAADGLVTSGKLDMNGRLGKFGVGVRSKHESLASGVEGFGIEGRANLVAVNLSHGSDKHLLVQAASDRFSTGGTATRDFESDSAQVVYSQDLGEDGQYRVAAHFADESFAPFPGTLTPRDLPNQMQTVQVDSEYSRQFNNRVTIQTGVRYQERTGVDGSAAGNALANTAERVDVFGRGGYRVRPAVLLEYGVYSVLHDGELALSPQGGFVIQLGELWQASTLLSGRLSESSEKGYSEVLSAYHDDAATCAQGEKFCGKFLVSRKNENNVLSIGAIHRQFGETLRLYFNDGLFRNLESLYVVPGDRLPEFQIALTRQLSPQVLTRVQSNVATGGGGFFYATDSDLYQNELRYIVTSIDTQFQATSTGVFLGFHHLEQNLDPMTEGKAQIARLDAERLQLKVTQDLNVLFELPADWALQLNMELTKGSLTADDQDEVRSRILGGIGVRF